MGFVLRIYYDDAICDVDLEDKTYFSIGSGKRDDYLITDGALKPCHICFRKANGIWSAKCAESVLLKGVDVKNRVVEIGDNFILNSDKKIAVTVFEAQNDGKDIFPLKNSDEALIGRDSNCEIQLLSKRSSGRHAKIYKIGSEYHISDIGSTNGTYVNNKRIRDTVLNDGDIITIDTYHITYQNAALSFAAGDDYRLNISTIDKADRKEYPYFKRSPRLKLEIPTGIIEIQAPPNIGTKPEINWLTVLIPPIAMVSIMISVVLLTNGNLTTLFYTAPMSLIGIMVSILNYQSQKKKHRKKRNAAAGKV